MAKQKLIKRSEFYLDVGLLCLRILFGSAMIYHGIDKVFEGAMPRFTEHVAGMGFPAPEFFAWAAAMSEMIGGILLFLGLQTRLAGLFIFLTMSVAVFAFHSAHPFYAKELAGSYWAISGFFVFAGGGRFSIDHRMVRP